MRNEIKITTYEDANHEFRWRMTRGGHVIADSGEGYKRHTAAYKAAVKLVTALDQGKYTFVPFSPLAHETAQKTHPKPATAKKRDESDDESDEEGA